jgi:hypothetical protein
LVLAPVAAALAAVAAAVADEPWEVVPEESLSEFRGGMDLGPLVANFAIQRVVEIDGVVVARMQVVISNLDRLGNGGMPTVTITGPIAEIVQFMKTTGNVSFAGSNVNVPSSVGALPGASAITVPSVPSAASTAAANSTGASTSPTVTSSGGNSGSVSAAGTQTGSLPQFGNALSNAVSTATSTANQPVPSGASSGSSGSGSAGGGQSGSAGQLGSSLANAVTSATGSSSQPASSGNSGNAPATGSQSGSAGQAGSASATAVSANTTRIIPVGTSGQVVVLSNLPNAAALTTAVQNEVHAATIQTMTTISATLNSIPALNAVNLGNSIRTMVGGG